MNRATGLAAVINSQASHLLVRSSFFHSTPFLERRKRNHWDSGSSFKNSPKKFNSYYRRLRKQNLLHDVSELAGHLFQSWQSDGDDCNPPRGQWSPWFRPGFREDGYRRKRTSRGLRTGNFEFCIDEGDDEFETIFRSAFGGSRHFFWSFTSDDEPRYRNSSSYSSYNRTFNSSRYGFSEESDSSSDHEKPNNKMTSDRLALGLSATGPLNLEDIKIAYRTCALKWHPDRHQGSSKVAAEEKFKACSAAYQSLCDGLALN